MIKPNNAVLFRDNKYFLDRTTLNSVLFIGTDKTDPNCLLAYAKEDLKVYKVDMMTFEIIDVKDISKVILSSILTSKSIPKSTIPASALRTTTDDKTLETYYFREGTETYLASYSNVTDQITNIIQL